MRDNFDYFSKKGNLHTKDVRVYFQNGMTYRNFIFLLRGKFRKMCNNFDYVNKKKNAPFRVITQQVATFRDNLTLDP